MELTIAGNLQQSEQDIVRNSTKPELNQKIDKEMERRIRFYSFQDRETISERISELDTEWDIERALEANAASLSLFGITMGIVSGRKWLILPLVVGGFLLQHATQGWCPPLPILRKLGFRTKSEIEQERYALKILRGDFDNLEKGEDGRIKRDIHRLISDLRIGGQGV
jgi:hypothetical protein